jgi:hypothetical protein
VMIATRPSSDAASRCSTTLASCDLMHLGVTWGRWR